MATIKEAIKVGSPEKIRKEEFKVFEERRDLLVNQVEKIKREFGF